MIVKPTLSPVRVVAYTKGPMLWTLGWSVGAAGAAAVWGADRVAIPYAPVGALAAALAIFVAFRNNTAFARWNEARVTWQATQAACRSLSRQVAAATDNSVQAGTADAAAAQAFLVDLVQRLRAFVRALALEVRPSVTGPTADELLDPGEWSRVSGSPNVPHALLLEQSVRIKAGIRDGVLGQFDPISLEPQLAALAGAQAAMERVASTPTPRQYDYFTRMFMLVYAAVTPFGLVGLLPDRVWLVVPLALVLVGVFVAMAVTGAANDEPFAGRVTDVAVSAITRDIERDLLAVAGHDFPPQLTPVGGYLW